MTQLHRSNPFSTRFVRPGAIPYFFEEGQSAPEIVSRLADHRWRGEIIGPHGSGKSTLVWALLPEIAAAGREPLRYSFHDGRVTLPGFNRHELELHSQAVLILDGYEQLGIWHRLRVRRACRQTGCGLLVTAHAPVGLPELYRTRVTPESAMRVVSHLICQPMTSASKAVLAAALAARRGNLREALFDLYDSYERISPELRRIGGVKVVTSHPE